ncbi:response regulator transcription factor [Bacillus suaedae]|uniref:Response regulator transcription factor n=1 Tax=Halalkalibacter suaedae TaxID=2822140 RepID=A0A940WYP3_9BACI|nr:LuxR C-terminal-related transcriptional regulator [Bacillus suaedae]MBP3953227.1 response regulator transcription factor [Bacillus suaedae]
MNSIAKQMIEEECRCLFKENKYCFETTSSISLKIGRNEDLVKEVLSDLEDVYFLSSKEIDNNKIYYLNDQNDENAPQVVINEDPTLNSIHEKVNRTNQLTKREKEISILIIKGLRNSEIAEILYISEHTVKNHVRNILNKLGLNGRQQLFRKIIE